MKYLIIALALAAGSASAGVEQLPASELHKAYWDCDYASANTMLGASEAADCSIVYEETLRRFSSTPAERYKLFMAWWQANKATEHAKRAK